MKLYQAFDVDEETPVQWLAVHPLRWQEHWGEPAIMFREVDEQVQALVDAAPDLLEACKLDKKYIQHIHLCSQCRTGLYCDDGMKLWAQSGDARDRAIAKAEEVE